MGVDTRSGASSIETTDHGDGLVLPPPPEETGRKNTAPAANPYQETKHRTVGNWLRAMPKSARVATGVAAAGLLIALPVRLWGSDETELTPPVDAADIEPDPGDDPLGVQGNSDAGPSGSGFSVEGLPPREELTTTARPPQESSETTPEAPEAVDSSDKAEWLSTWSASIEATNGLEATGRTRQLLDDVVGNLRMRINMAEDAGSEYEARQFSDIRISTGYVVLIENTSGVIAADNLVTYGLRVSDEDAMLINWSYRADAATPVYEMFYHMYRDENGKWQGFATFKGELATLWGEDDEGVVHWHTDPDAKVVGMFTYGDGAEIVAGRIDPESLGRFEEPMVVEKSDGTGDVLVPGAAYPYPNTDIAWDELKRYEQELKPADPYSALRNLYGNE